MIPYTFNLNKKRPKQIIIISKDKVAQEALQIMQLDKSFSVIQRQQSARRLQSASRNDHNRSSLQSQQSQSSKNLLYTSPQKVRKLSIQTIHLSESQLQEKFPDENDKSFVVKIDKSNTSILNNSRLPHINSSLSKRNRINSINSKIDDTISYTKDNSQLKTQIMQKKFIVNEQYPVKVIPHSKKIQSYYLKTEPANHDDNLPQNILDSLQDEKLTPLKPLSKDQIQDYRIQEILEKYKYNREIKQDFNQINNPNFITPVKTNNLKRDPNSYRNLKHHSLFA